MAPTTSPTGGPPFSPGPGMAPWTTCTATRAMAGSHSRSTPFVRSAFVPICVPPSVHFAAPDAGSFRRSRRQALDDPAVALPPVAEAVVEAVGLLLPELDTLGGDPVAAPASRTGHVRVIGVSLGDLGHLRLEGGPARDDLALTGRGGAASRAGRAGQPVTVGLGLAHPLDRPAHAHLTMDGQEPVEDGGG